MFVENCKFAIKKAKLCQMNGVFLVGVQNDLRQPEISTRFLFQLRLIVFVQKFICLHFMLEWELLKFHANIMSIAQLHLQFFMHFTGSVRQY